MDGFAIAGKERPEAWIDGGTIEDRFFPDTETVTVGLTDHRRRQQGRRKELKVVTALRKLTAAD